MISFIATPTQNFQNNDCMGFTIPSSPVSKKTTLILAFNVGGVLHYVYD